MNHKLLGVLLLGIAAPESARAQRTEVPTESAARSSLHALKVTTFTIANGSPVTADRDITYQIAFEGTTALYKIAEGARSTAGWSIASRNSISVPLRLIAGPEGRRTLYLDIRKDASSATSLLTVSIDLKYPSQTYYTSGITLNRTAPAFQFASSERRTSASGKNCFVTYQMYYQAGTLPAEADLTFYRGLSPETVCEFKLLSRRNLKPGWTLKSAKVKFRIAPIAGARCEITRAAWGTSNPELTILVRHPGSINPLDYLVTMCHLEEVTFQGPDDPDVDEKLENVLSTSW